MCARTVFSPFMFFPPRGSKPCRAHRRKHGTRRDKCGRYKASMAIRTIHYRKPACSGRFEANKPNRGANGNETICEYQSRGHRGGTGITIAQMEKMDRLWCAFDVNIYCGTGEFRSEEHTSELQSLMRRSYAVLCLQKT